MTEETNQRFKRILAAYKDAIGDRDPADVNVVDLLPAIFKAAPDAEVDDIVAALGWQGERAMREAEALREYSRAAEGRWTTMSPMAPRDSRAAREGALAGIVTFGGFT